MRVLALSGSLKEASHNSALVRAAVRVAPEGLQVQVFGLLGQIPGLDPEQDGPRAPGAVSALRTGLAQSDGLLIATPEYGHSVPGTLKNALDWLVGSGELSGLPVAVVSASTTMTGGIRGQMALIQTLLAQAAQVSATLTVPGVKGKLDSAGEIGDAAVLRRVRETLVALAEAVQERRAWLAN